MIATVGYLNSFMWQMIQILQGSNKIYLIAAGRCDRTISDRRYNCKWTKWPFKEYSKFSNGNIATIYDNIRLCYLS